MPMNRSKQILRQGFSLLELSIVLVVMGLIIGGVLVGIDLIAASTIRSTIAQYKEFQTICAAFEDKYGDLPGDIEQTKAKDFGLYDRTAVAAEGNGDSNGLLQSCADNFTTGSRAGCETLLFWRDLNDAGLINGSYQSATAAQADNGAAIATKDLSKFLPESPLEGNFWTVFHKANANVDTANYYALTNITSIDADGTYNLDQFLTPVIADQIDTKIDDGLAMTGAVRGMQQNVNIIYLCTPSATACIDNLTNDYNMRSSYRDINRCQLRFDF